MMGMVFATVALFFHLCTFLDKRLTTVKHAFGVECRPQGAQCFCMIV